MMRPRHQSPLLNPRSDRSGSRQTRDRVPNRTPTSSFGDSNRRPRSPPGIPGVPGSGLPPGSSSSSFRNAGPASSINSPPRSSTDTPLGVNSGPAYVLTSVVGLRASTSSYNSRLRTSTQERPHSSKIRTFFYSVGG